MPHLNVTRLRARLDAADRREDELVEQDIAIQRVRADIALEWAANRTAIIALCKIQGISENAWCKANMGRALRTLLGYLQVAKQWPEYERKRRADGNCGRYGIEFALELIAKPRPETATKRGGSASGNANRTKHKGKPEGQNTRTPLPAYRFMDGICRYDADGCAGSKKVALTDRYFNDLLNADVRGLRLFANGPFGMNAQLAAYFPHCGAQHVTWLTTAGVNTNWFHDWVLPNAKHILFPSKRIKFHGHDNTLASDLMMVLYGDVPPALRPHLTHSITCSSIVLP